MSAPLDAAGAELEDDPTEGPLAEEEPEEEPEEVWRSAADDPAPSHRRCIIHIDIDCFYAQVEMLERPELRDRPLGIQQKNIVVTSNYAARARGVGKCCLVAEAVRACPELVLVNGSDLTRYRRMSSRIHRLLTRFSRRVERLGFDENYLDVTDAAAAAAREKDALSADAPPGHALGDAAKCACGCAGRLAAAAHLAAQVRRALRDELGISSCAGVGFNKLLAKLAGATHKPDQQTVVYAAGVDDLLLSAAAVRALPGIGSRTNAQLAELGVRSVADLRRATPAQLQPLGSAAAAAALRALAFGVDPAEVKPSSAALSIGVEDGFRRVDSVEECEVKIRELARRVLVLLAEDGRVPAVLKLSIRRYNREDYGRFRESRQTKVPPSLFVRWRDKELEVADRLVAEALVLLKKMLKDEPFHLTLLGLAVTGFSEQSDTEQASIARFVQKDATSATKRKSVTNSAADDAPPGGVDPGVWDSLPTDIKSELLRDQQLSPAKKRRQQSIASFFGGSAGLGTSKDSVDIVTLDDDPVCAVAPEETAGATADAVSRASRSSSRSPVGAREGDSDPDDPGSPVISRAALTRCETRSGGHGSTSSVESAAGEGPIDSDTTPADPPVKFTGPGGSERPQSMAGCVERVAAILPLRTAATPQSPAAAGVAPSSVNIIPDTSAGSSPADRVSQNSCHQRTEAHSAAPLPTTGDTTGTGAGAGTETGTGAGAGAGAGAGTGAGTAAGTRAGTGTGAGVEAETGAGTGAGAEDWDPDVFSQLPPDIQFELKMARRSEGRGSGGGVSPRRPAPGPARAGNILSFFKK